MYLDDLNALSELPSNALKDMVYGSSLGAVYVGSMENFVPGVGMESAARRVVDSKIEHVTQGLGMVLAQFHRHVPLNPL